MNLAMNVATLLDFLRLGLGIGLLLAGLAMVGLPAFWLAYVAHEWVNDWSIDRTARAIWVRQEMDREYDNLRERKIDEWRASQRARRV